VSRARRSIVQQEERHTEQRAAEHRSDAEAPPPSALFPQGSTLLRGQCTRADTKGRRGVLEKLDNRSACLQTRDEQQANRPLFPQVTLRQVRDISVNTQVTRNVVENSIANVQVTRFSHYTQRRVN
jgi:hypothetical protein